MDIYFWVVLIAIAAGLVQGFSGFGGAAVAVPLFAMVLDLQSSVALITLLGILIGLLNVWTLRGHLRMPYLIRLVVSALAGVPVGVVMLTSFPERLMLLILALLLIVQALYDLRGYAMPWLANVRYAYPTGALAGWLGATVGVNGPPIIVYTAAQPWSLMEKKGTLAAFLLVTSMLTASGHAIGGVTTSSVMAYFATAALPLLLATWVGIRLFDHVGSKHQRVLVNLVIAGVGLLLAYKAAVG